MVSLGIEIQAINMIVSGREIVEHYVKCEYSFSLINFICEVTVMLFLVNITRCTVMLFLVNIIKGCIE